MDQNQPRVARWVPIALCALVIASLGVSLMGDFVWDDRPLIVESGRVKDTTRLGEIFSTGFWETGDSHDRFRSFFRPLVSASFALDYRVWGLKPFGFHLTNLLLHLACTLLVLRVARRVGLSDTPAFYGAALFAVHPVHVESVAWISGRTDLLATMFVLFSFATFLESSTGEKKRWLSWGLFLAAMMSKEAAAPLPAIVLASVWLVTSRRRWAAALSASAPYFAILAGYALMRSTVLGSAASPLYTLEPLAWMGTTSFVIGRYLTLLLIPLGLDAHYPYTPVDSWLDPRFAIGAAMCGVALFGAYRLAREDRVLAVWPLWIALMLTPVLAFGRFGDVLMADRFLYLPSVGYCMLAAFGMRALLQWDTAAKRRFSQVVASLVLLVFVGLSASRVGIWRTDQRLFADMLVTSPDSALVHNNLGQALYVEDEVGRAIDHFTRATELAPTFALAHNNLAAALHVAGRTQEALPHYSEALRLAPGLMMAGANGGHLLVELGRVQEGLDVLGRTVAAHPDAPSALYAYADALHLAGRANEALGWLDDLQSLDPEFPQAFYLRGKIYADLGRSSDAAKQMKAFLRRWHVEDRRADRARAVIAAATS